MPETRHQTFSGITETRLVTLSLRALESHRPDTIITDEKAVKLVKQMSFGFAQGRQKADNAN